MVGPNVFVRVEGRDQSIQTVGRRVGIVGRRVGRGVGARVGFIVGRRVGRGVVGTLVGGGEGFIVGLFVGGTVGTLVGVKVGLVVVGVEVGVAVAGSGGVGARVEKDGVEVTSVSFNTSILAEGTNVGENVGEE